MKKVLRYVLLAIPLAAIIATAVYLYRQSQPADEHYELVSPQFGDIQTQAILTGSIEPRDEIAVKPQISGIISEIMVQPGDMVTTGQEIARIEVIPDASQLSSATTRAESAKIALADVETRHARNAQLFEQKIISREEFESTLTELSRARQELEAANDAVEIAAKGISRYNASQASTTVRATASGLVLDVPVKKGSSVIQANTFNEGTTIATIADMSNIIFKGQVDETEVGNLAVGLPMTITIGALPDFSYDTSIEYISPKSSTTTGTRTFEIKAPVVTDGKHELRSGYSANAMVTTHSTQGAMKLPESVIEFSGDSAFVYVLTDSVPQQIFRRQSIVTGLSDGISIEVRNGLDKKALIRGQKL